MLQVYAAIALLLIAISALKYFLGIGTKITHLSGLRREDELEGCVERGALLPDQIFDGNTFNERMLKSSQMSKST